jgi:outer membrane protein assembly factor BamE (lipoprotein component of BamABCDE complex)
VVAAVQPGIDNRESVQGTLGRPTFTGQFDQRDWYYVSRETKQLAFASPRADRADRPPHSLQRGRAPSNG